MSNKLSRRIAVKLIGLSSALFGSHRSLVAQSIDNVEREPVVDWSTTHDRVWLGGECWANPMEDWRIVDGSAEVQSGGGDRNIHLLTHELTNANEPFLMSVAIERISAGPQESGVGFLIGIQSDVKDHRANCFTKNGIRAGLIGSRLTLGSASVAIDNEILGDQFELLLTNQISPADGLSKLTLRLRSTTQQYTAVVENKIAADELLGNVAIVSNYDPAAAGRSGSRFRFRDWTVDGPAFSVKPERRFGPILWTMYALSDSRTDEHHVLKLTCLTGPLGSEDNKDVELHLFRDGEWTLAATAVLDLDAWTATFRLPNWDASSDVRYKTVYRESRKESEPKICEWLGTVKADPKGRPLRIAALTCQNDYAFPYAPVADNVAKMAPDLAYFSGDQIYENHGGYGLIRDPAELAILNYLRKFYQFGWSFREVMRNCPTICLPDDHDVFQGNIWGENGAAMDDGDTSSRGGYREPARMVNVVHRTNTSHHPDAYDPTPVLQSISVYYGDMLYGGVGFAVIADRQFKSGPERVDTGSGRADHVTEADFDTSVLDKPGLELLGHRQEEFLRKWAQDWRGHSMKILLSQTVFAGAATHHGEYDGYLKADLDCGGWPQSPRNRAIELLRQAKPLHINGDQHLTSLVQYGVDKQRDSFWSFCTPAIAVGYPRWWRPDELGTPHENRPAHGNPDTGEYLDGLGNKMYLYAVGNPEVATKKNRYQRAHQKASGFGFVTVDSEARTYKIESFRFLVDASSPDPKNQFPGWPVTIHQDENAGQNRLR